jgi:hypothetical protein
METRQNRWKVWFVRFTCMLECIIWAVVYSQAFVVLQAYVRHLVLAVLLALYEHVLLQEEVYRARTLVLGYYRLYI